MKSIKESIENMNKEHSREKIQKAREFCQKVKILAEKYHLPFFIVTDGASCTNNFGCPAVKNARDAHIVWEKKHNLDPFESWDEKKSKL